MSKAIKEANIEEVAEEVVEEVIGRPYNLRKLQDDDLLPLLHLLRKIGFKEAIETYAKYKNNVKFNPADYETKEEAKKAFDELRESQGMDMVLEFVELILSKLDTHSNSIYEFFSRLAGVPADDIKKMEFGTLPLMVFDCISEVKNTSFFKVLFKLL